MSGAWAIVGKGENAAFVHRWHDGQQAVWDSDARYLAAIAGSGGGKSHMGGPWLYREARLNPGMEFIAAEPTWTMVERVMWPILREIIEPTGGVMREDYADVACGNGKMARIWLASADRPQRIEGVHAKGAWLDEAGQMPSLMLETTMRRLRLHKGRLLLTTTPYDMGWLKVDFYDRWESRDPDYFVSQFASTANPSYSVEEFEKARQTMPDWRFKMMHLGEFDRPPGLIYSCYSDELREKGGQRVADFDIPPEWPRYVGVDFGGVHTATVWLALDPATNVAYVYRDTLEGDMTTAQHAKLYQERAAGTNVVMVYGGAASEEQYRRDWAQAGVPVQRPLVADVESGIDKVIGMFKTQRLWVFDSCRGLRDELGRYSRVLDDRGQATEKIRDKETFHRLDSLRYIVPRLVQPEMRVRWMG